MKKNKNNLSSVIINNGTVALLNSISSFILNFVYAYVLGLELFGEITLVLSISTVIFSFGSFGVVSCITRSLMTYVSKNKNYNSYITLIYLTILICSILLFFPFYFLTVKLYSFDSEYFNYVIGLFCVHIFFFLPYMIGVSILESNQKMNKYLFANTLSLIFKYLSIPILFIYEIDLFVGLFIYFIIPQFILFVAIFYGLIKENLYKISFSIDRDDFENLYELIKYTFKLTFVMISDAIIINYPIIFLSRYGLSEVGLFKLLFSIINLGLIIPGFLGKSLLPIITDFHLKAKENLFKKFFLLFEKSSFSIMFLIAISLMFFGEYFFLIYKKDEILLIYILLLSFIIYVLSGNFISVVFGAINKPEYISYCLVSGAFLNIVFIEIFDNFFNSPISIVLSSILLSYCLQQASLFYTAFRMNLIILKFKNKIAELSLLIISVILIHSTNLLINDINVRIAIHLLLLVSLLSIYYKIVFKYNFFDDFELKQINYFLRKLKIK